ncbi:hypothetical protein SISSUDRAFT_1068188 [Sistotremastrum suecicum HHB10207 ss-3]|uniref:Uncharacterized protein n=1 Tax=Sistotremastrum suecicum HHB10207 ss-3 TaxID=1314776 RepID=A0A165WE10_9AGAM|nr:hypothetical protein SISSUDRAFT_1068188 [Sistotremastrum suecicum HHB10207 ss-3]
MLLLFQYRTGRQMLHKRPSNNLAEPWEAWAEPPKVGSGETLRDSGATVVALIIITYGIDAQGKSKKASESAVKWDVNRWGEIRV